MKNKGFTLVELLVAISILAILTIIAIPTLRAFQAGNDKKTYENYGKSMVASAKLYNDSYSEDLFGNLENGCQKVTLTEMINKKVAKDITLKDITCNKPDKDSYVLVWKYKGEYAFDPIVNCENSKGTNQYEDKNEALAEACVTATGKPYITVNTISNQANNTKKKSVIITLNDEFGFTANQEIEYAFSTINDDNGTGVTGYKSYKYNNSYIKRSSGTVKLSTDSITIPSETTGTYYLYVKPKKVQNIINESITNIHKFGPYRFDHEPPACPTIKAYKDDGSEVAKNTPAGINKFTISYSVDDLQNYELQISYDNGSTWSTATTYGKDKTEYIPTKDGTIKIKTRAKDYANNQSNWCTSNTYIRDTTAPSAPTVTGYKKTSAADITSKGSLPTHPTNTWLSGWLFTQASGSTDANGVTYYYTTTGATTNNSNVQASYRNINAEGESTVKYRARDDAGNWSGWTSYIAKLDRTPPNCPTVVAKVGSSTLATDTWTNGSKVDFTFTFSTDTNKWDWYTDSSTNDKTVNGITYKLWSSNNNTSSNTGSISGQGKRMVLTRVYDQASNASDCPFGTYNIDRCEATTASNGAWSDCNKTCGGGTKTRTITNYSSVTGHTTHVCSTKTESTSCNTQSCTTKVIIQLKANGGTFGTNHGSQYTIDSEGYILKNGSRNIHVIPYNGSLSDTGLLNYHNPSHINLYKDCQLAVKNEEWINESNGKTYNEDTQYEDNEFCNASSRDCTVTLSVNWGRYVKTTKAFYWKYDTSDCRVGNNDHDDAASELHGRPYRTYYFYNYRCYCLLNADRTYCGQLYTENTKAPKGYYHIDDHSTYKENHATVYYEKNSDGSDSCYGEGNEAKNENVYRVCQDSGFNYDTNNYYDIHGYRFYKNKSLTHKYRKFGDGYADGEWTHLNGDYDQRYKPTDATGRRSEKNIIGACNFACNQLPEIAERDIKNSKFKEVIEDESE